VKTILLIASLLIAQAPLVLTTVRGRAPAPQSTATVQGTVVKQGTGEPLSKATVSLYHEHGPLFVAITDSEGNFSISNVTPGEYQLTASRLGYVRAEYGDRASNGCGTPVVLIAGQRLTNARISMWPDSVISGHLYDTDREGMSAVSVSALKYAYENGRRILTIVQTVQTNDLGEFRLFGLPPGRYYVAVALLSTKSPPAGIISADRPDVPGTLLNLEPPTDPRFPGKRFLPVYFPGVDDPQGRRQRCDECRHGCFSGTRAQRAYPYRRSRRHATTPAGWIEIPQPHRGIDDIV